MGRISSDLFSTVSCVRTGGGLGDDHCPRPRSAPHCGAACCPRTGCWWRRVNDVTDPAVWPPQS
jgi:hypothetical protein